jgi:hypothetical protein
MYKKFVESDIQARSDPKPKVAPAPMPAPQPVPQLATAPRPEPKPKRAPAPKPKPQQTAAAKKPLKSSFWVGLSLDAAGAGILFYGLSQESRVADIKENGYGRADYDKAVNHAKNRDTAYWLGAAALLSGISIQIFF